jgi:carbamoyl-phosphate synthase large subunit
VKLDLLGSINIQLRMTGNLPKIFEINPRFSSTVLYRHLFGFEDLIWSIEDRLGLELSDNRQEFIGRKFYKGYVEYIK